MIKRHMKLSTGIGFRAVEHAGVLHFSGFIADDFSEGMAGQTLQVCQKMKKALEDIGSSKDNVLTATIYLADFSKKEEMNRVWVDWFKGDQLPARSTIGVATLGPGILIEVVITAAA